MAECPVCGADDHSNTSCSQPPSCLNCNEAHPSYSRRCQVYLNEREIRCLKEAEGLPYAMAVTHLCLQGRLPSVSYSRVSKHPPISGVPSSAASSVVTPPIATPAPNPFAVLGSDVPTTTQSVLTSSRPSSQTPVLTRPRTTPNTNRPSTQKSKKSTLLKSSLPLPSLLPPPHFTFPVSVPSSSPLSGSITSVEIHPPPRTMPSTPVPSQVSPSSATSQVSASSVPPPPTLHLQSLTLFPPPLLWYSPLLSQSLLTLLLLSPIWSPIHLQIQKHLKPFQNILQRLNLQWTLIHFLFLLFPLLHLHNPILHKALFLRCLNVFQCHHTLTFLTPLVRRCLSLWIPGIFFIANHGLFTVEYPRPQG
nr:mucin-2-like [Cherax quadricarinatus]